MSHDIQAAWPAPAEPPADLLTELVGMLAAVLRLKAEKIDPEQTFRLLGLDSLLTVEFVATVNSRYGTAVKADALFDHPTPLSFARHLARERGTLVGAPVALPPRPDTRPAPARARAPRVATGSAAGAVLDVLREELARILCCDPWDINTTTAFPQLGVDSILGSEFVATINQIYGLHERAVTLYDHPNLAAMAAHIASAAPAAAAAATAPDPAAESLDVEALLDAVADDRITVDEALALLSR
ncbi:phosphopantetheine-binding protein [Streptomyces sp. NPDC048304]|uniref:phosphopantetheine-binding protein n=1 Tax=Streptomyces sp. NPDC048304 TaxID=3154820 RepID=UPI0033C134F5